MHDSVRRFGELMLTWGRCADANVLEVGSLDVNGSLRPIVTQQKSATYLGIDMRMGPGVEIVCKAEDIPYESRLRDGYDLVICTEMLEHAEQWYAALYGVKWAVKLGGLLLFTTRGPGFGRHDHPADFWRFTTDLIAETMTGFRSLALMEDPDSPGVFYCGERIDPTLEGIQIPVGLKPEPAPE